MAGWHLSLPIHSWTLHCKPTLLWIFRNTASRSSHFTGNDWKETSQPSVLLSLRRVIRTKNKKRRQNGRGCWWVGKHQIVFLG